jgi:hypothetical protein
MAADFWARRRVLTFLMVRKWSENGDYLIYVRLITKSAHYVVLTRRYHHKIAHCSMALLGPTLWAYLLIIYSVRMTASYKSQY